MTTVLVTGATGRVGRHVVAGLVGHGARVRALVRHPLTAALPPEVEIVPGDLLRPDTVRAAAAGADAAFLLWPGFSADGAADAVAALSEVAHLVYLSAARLQHGAEGVTPGVWADVEALVEGAGATWTFLRAGGFAANTLGWAPAIRAGDVVAVPHPDAARSLVHERDLADVAVRALLDPALAGRALALTGPQVLSQREQVAAIGAALGRELRVHEQATADVRRELATTMGDEYAGAALDHWATLVDEPERVTGDVEQVLDRPARPFAQWARDHVGDFARLSTAEVAQAYATAFRTGRVDEALALLDPDVVRVAPLEDEGRPVEVRGVAAIVENAQRQNVDVELHGVTVDEPLVGGDRFAIRFSFDETDRRNGTRRTTTKVSLCTVAASRIVREEVSYFSPVDGRRSG